jgi:hypothetical protein
MNIKLSKSEKFFYDHGGYNWESGRETEEQGRIRCAKQSARAERKALDEGLRFVWDSCPDSDHSYLEQEPDTCEMCACIDQEGNVLASLGCIDDAEESYRRVIESELAIEALEVLCK